MNTFGRFLKRNRKKLLIALIAAAVSVACVSSVAITAQVFAPYEITSYEAVPTSPTSAEIPFGAVGKSDGFPLNPQDFAYITTAILCALAGAFAIKSIFYKDSGNVSYKDG